MSANLTGELTLREIMKATGFVAPEKNDEPVLKILEESDDLQKMNETTPICLSDMDMGTMKSWNGKKVMFHCDIFDACDCIFKGKMIYEVNDDIHLDTYKDNEFVIDFTGRLVYIHEEECADWDDWYIKVLE